MIDRKVINSLPTSVREEISAHLLRMIEVREREGREAADAFVARCDDIHRSAALMARGSLEAYNEMYAIFKV